MLAGICCTDRRSTCAGRYELGSEEDGMEAARQKTSALIPRFHVMLTTYEVGLVEHASFVPQRKFPFVG